MISIWNNRRGTTLVEILVVMLILLVGIMIIIQMFPVGFRVVRAAESQTIATKLAQAEIERWKNMPGNLPDGILPIIVNPEKPEVNDILNDQEPGPPFHGIEGPAGGPFTIGNALNFRYVRNEVATLPIGSYFSTGGGAVFGSRYVLAFSPIEAFADPANPNLYIGLTVKSGDLRRRRGDADSDPPYLRAGRYAIDYTISNGAFHMALADRDPNHAYAISYSYWVSKSSGGDSQYLSRTDQAIAPRADGGWIEVPVSVPADYDVDQIEPNSDSCARMFQSVTTGSWSDDPYEYALADAVMGVLAFNPRARNMSEYTARGVRAITARIDYRIYDPRIIREDKVVPPPNESSTGTTTNDRIAIKLALRFILSAGQPDDVHDGDATDNPDEPTFEGLVRQHLGMVVTSPNNLWVKDSILIIDLQTGLRVSMVGVNIDFKGGVVHLPATTNLVDWSGGTAGSSTSISLVGRHLRFFYRADGDWSVQCQKAYSNYTREYGTPRLDYCHFRLQGNQLLFPMCDAGKNVTVDYTWISDRGGAPHRVVGKTFRISDSYTVDTTGQHCPFITLDVPDYEKDAYIDPDARIMVVGSSYRARVVWRDGTHWRFVDIDTNLTRSSTP